MQIKKQNRGIPGYYSANADNICKNDKYYMQTTFTLTVLIFKI